MKKLLFFILLSLFWVLFLFPKAIIWSSFVDEMRKNGISVEAKHVDMKLFLLYNKIDIRDMLVANMLRVKSLEIKYTLLNPLHVDMYGDTEFGNFQGDISLLDTNGYILIKKSKNLGILRRYFKKSSKGYKYEFDF